MNDNMKFTRSLISSQDQVLVAVIQWLDSNGQSNSQIREIVDTCLNHMDSTKKLSEEELNEAENAEA